MLIFIRLWNSIVIQMDVEPTMTTRDVKWALCHLHDIPPRNCRLNELGWPAREHQLALGAQLLEYDIQPHTVLYQVLDCGDAPWNRLATLLLQDESGNRLTIDISSMADVNRIRTWVDCFDGWYGIPPEQQLYFYRGIELMPRIPLHTYGISREEDVAFHKVLMRRRWPPSAPHHCNDQDDGFSDA